MPRPQNKAELLELSALNFSRLVDFIESNPDKLNLEFRKGTMNRNVRDVVTHLHEWHIMMHTWYDLGMSGKKPEMPAPGYTWKTTPKLNEEIWNKYQSTTLEEGLALLKDSYGKIQELILSHTEEELFTKKKYKWTGSTSLGSYLISATSSHYDWAFKLIRKGWKG